VNYQEAGQLPDFAQGFESQWFLAKIAGMAGGRRISVFA
jgi:hypothetical protein